MFDLLFFGCCFLVGCFFFGFCSSLMPPSTAVFPAGHASISSGTWYLVYLESEIVIGE
jgi:hypothetical protein